MGWSTVGELRRRAQARAAERARSAWLDEVRQRGADAWRDVEAEITCRNAAAYERAATLLADLKTVAAKEEGTLDASTAAWRTYAPATRVSRNCWPN